MVDDTESSEAELVGELADEFLARWKSGQSLSIEEFASQHPEVAESIRALFPILLLLEVHQGGSSQTSACDDWSLVESELPRRLGEYELLRELGRGGMGIVFEARQETLDRHVAIKILPGSSVYDTHTRRRFLQEARIIARLKHPRIVPIHAVGEHDDVLYYVMDLISGTSLDQLLITELAGANGPRRARWVARLGIEAAESLAYAHAQGVIHRDVKPSNFVLDQEGKLWLTDFGLAKLLGDTSLTASGQWLGTLRYLAPECLRGESSVRSDVYGLGLTLYELLVGLPAFPEEDRTRLMKLIAETVPLPPHRFDPTIPRDLETIIVKASAREPEQRYRSAIEMAEDLKRFLDGRPILGRIPHPEFGSSGGSSAIVALASLGAISIALALIIVWLIAFAPFSSGRTASDVDPASPRASASVSKDEPEVSSPPNGVAKDGPPWGFGRRHSPAGAGAGGGRGPRGPRRGMGPF